MTSNKFGTEKFQDILILRIILKVLLHQQLKLLVTVTAQITVVLFPELLVNYKKYQILSGIIPKFDVWSFSKKIVGVDMIASE